MLTCLNIGLSGCWKQSYMGGKQPHWHKSNKKTALFTLFHNTKLDFVSDHFCLLVLVLSSFSLFGENKLGESRIPLEVVTFPVLHTSCSAHLDQCYSVWSVHLCQSANSHWYTAEIESKRSETLIATWRSYFFVCSIKLEKELVFCILCFFISFF